MTEQQNPIRCSKCGDTAWAPVAGSFFRGEQVTLPCDCRDDHPLLQMGEDLRPTTIKAKR